MGTAPWSTERKVLIAGAVTLLSFALLMVIVAFARSLPILLAIAVGLLPALAVSIGWLIAACGLALVRKWRAALLATIVFMVLLAGANWQHQISKPLEQAAVWLEFTIYRSSYDDLVIKTPKGEVPRFIRVSQRQIDDFRPHFEEIWFDESDALGSVEYSARAARVETAHPRRPDQTRLTSFVIRPLGGHYYFVDVRLPN